MRENYALGMLGTLPEAKAELLGWIEDRTVVDYWLVYKTLAPGGLVSKQKLGLGTLHQELDSVIILSEPSGEQTVVTASGREIIDYCEPQVEGEGYRVQVRSRDSSTSIAFKPSKYRL
jgi:hypothetical protein